MPAAYRAIEHPPWHVDDAVRSVEECGFEGEVGSGDCALVHHRRLVVGDNAVEPAGDETARRIGDRATARQVDAGPRGRGAAPDRTRIDNRSGIVDLKA